LDLPQWGERAAAQQLTALSPLPPLRLHPRCGDICSPRRAAAGETEQTLPAQPSQSQQNGVAWPVSGTRGGGLCQKKLENAPEQQDFAIIPQYLKREKQITPHGLGCGDGK